MTEYHDCKNEQQFKMKWLKLNARPDVTHFCIESEETVKGFPDVMCIDNDTKQVSFIEFKYTKNSRIKFQPTQPAFYKKYFYLPVHIVAYDAKTDKVHYFTKENLFYEKSPYRMNDKAEVQL